MLCEVAVLEVRCGCKWIKVPTLPYCCSIFCKAVAIASSVFAVSEIALFEIGFLTTCCRFKTTTLLPLASKALIVSVVKAVPSLVTKAICVLGKVKANWSGCGK